jgi:KUP system potassium uptake protein
MWSKAAAPVCVKYLTFIIRADHDGEGGTLAMLALIQKKRPPLVTASPGVLVLLVLVGSALLYGDDVITPAISVLSAVEGIKMATPGAQRIVVPMSLAILVGLFLLQSQGTGVVGRLFLNKVWNWPLAGVLALVGLFLIVDLTFLAGNISKIVAGAKVRLVLGLFVFAVFWI